MKTTELIEKILTAWGLPVVKKGENTIVFRFQRNYIQAFVPGTDGEARQIVVTLGCFYEPPEGEDPMLAMRVCNDISAQNFHIKAYIDTDSDVTLTSEFFFTTTDDLERSLEMGLEGLVSAKSDFISRIHNLREEASIISDLNSMDD